MANVASTFEVALNRMHTLANKATKHKLTLKLWVDIIIITMMITTIVVVIVEQMPNVDMIRVAVAVVVVVIVSI